MEKNELLTVRIEDMTSEGEGVGKIDAFPLFIKDACPGDLAVCKVMKLKKTYGYARLMEVLEPSPDRVNATCEKARACGGCQLQEMNYEAQKRFKARKVRENLRRIGGISAEVEPCLGMEEPWRYRNKAQIPFGKDRAGKVIAGFYAGRTHDIIEMEDCRLAPEEVARVTFVVKDWIVGNGISVYDEGSGRGLIRHLLVRKGFTTGQLLVCVIANGDRLPAAEELRAALSEVPGFMTLCLNVNREPGNTILGRETRTLFGPGYIEDYIGDVKFRISPNSFFQVNPVMTRVLYGKALEFAGLTGNENVWDLYCGIGTISLFLAKQARKVYGVEIVPQAIEDARENAALNGLGNAEFFVGKAEEVLPHWYAAHPEEKIDVVVVDPPRKGCDEVCLDTIVRMAPERLVYVSCDSATLARDLKILCGRGFRVERVQPVDMFPETVHVETVVLLSKGVIDSHKVRVEFPLDGLDTASLRGKATYEQIQAYVEEKTGLKVSSLYISQVKRKCGLEVGESFNKAKSNDARVPVCPPEKETAILEALKHFGMI